MLVEFVFILVYVINSKKLKEVKDKKESENEVPDEPEGSEI